jgi:hypothetical protein
VGLIDQIKCASHLPNLNQDECLLDYRMGEERRRFRLACSQARGFMMSPRRVDITAI